VFPRRWLCRETRRLRSHRLLHPLLCALLVHLPPPLPRQALPAKSGSTPPPSWLRTKKKKTRRARSTECASIGAIILSIWEGSGRIGGYEEEGEISDGEVEEHVWEVHTDKEEG
jgi:hypothetical protein